MSRDTLREALGGRLMQLVRRRVAAVDVPGRNERRNWKHHASDSFMRAIEDRRFLLELHDEIQRGLERPEAALEAEPVGLDVEREHRQLLGAHHRLLMVTARTCSVCSRARLAGLAERGSEK